MEPELKQTLEAMAQTLAALDARVASLEAALASSAPAQAAPPAVLVEAAAPVAPAPAAAQADQEIAPEVLLAISAAVAAFLGERAHVRQIRLISSQAWGQQGRVNVQASHTLYR